MMPLAGKPLGQWILEKCFEANPSSVLLCVNEKHAGYIKNCFASWNILYSVSPGLGSAGELYLANQRGLLENNFIVYYGDTLITFNLADLAHAHFQNKSDVTLVVSQNAKIRWGIIQNKQLFEKPLIKTVCPDCYATLGIFASNQQILKYCKPGLDIMRDVMPLMLQKHRVAFWNTDTPWFGCDTFKDLEEAEKWVTSAQLSSRQ